MVMVLLLRRGWFLAGEREKGTTARPVTATVKRCGNVTLLVSVDERLQHPLPPEANEAAELETHSKRYPTKGTLPPPTFLNPNNGDAEPNFLDDLRKSSLVAVIVRRTWNSAS